MEHDGGLDRAIAEKLAWGGMIAQSFTLAQYRPPYCRPPAGSLSKVLP